MEGVNFVAKEAKKLFQAIYEMNSRQRWENQGATLFSGKPCQIITSNSGLFFDLSGEVSHTETAWMLGESDRLHPGYRKLSVHKILMSATHLILAHK